MKMFVAVTDYDWYRILASKPVVEGVNFWKPSPDATFKALDAGDLLLFKLHAPRNFIAGGGFFARFLRLPLSLAWAAFGEGNGARSIEEVRHRIISYCRRTTHNPRLTLDPHDDPYIGCILLEEPFFFDEADWIAVPADFSPRILTIKRYYTGTETGDASSSSLGRTCSSSTSGISRLRAPSSRARNPVPRSSSRPAWGRARFACWWGRPTAGGAR